jgi:hypothetical protein
MEIQADLSSQYPATAKQRTPLSTCVQMEYRLHLSRGKRIVRIGEYVIIFFPNSDLPIGDREEERRSFLENKYQVLVTTKEWLQRSVHFHLNSE